MNGFAPSLTDEMASMHRSADALALRAHRAMRDIQNITFRRDDALALALALDDLDSIGVWAQALAESLRETEPCATCGSVRGVEYQNPPDLFQCPRCAA